MFGGHSRGPVRGWQLGTAGGGGVEGRMESRPGLSFSTLSTVQHTSPSSSTSFFSWLGLHNAALRADPMHTANTHPRVTVHGTRIR